MKKTSQLQKEDFDALLKWFSLNKEKAGEEYEKIRQWLINFFTLKGCSDTEFLADETINRVALKLPNLKKSQNTKKTSIFYGFANNIFREYIKQFKQKEVQLNPDWDIFDSDSVLSYDFEDSELKNLDKCLNKLKSEDRELILEYYSEEKITKINLRKHLANQMNIKVETLHVKVHRIKKVLKKCLEGVKSDNS